MNDGIGKELTELTKEVNAVDLTEGAYTGARRLGLRRMILGVTMSVMLLGGGVAGAVTLWPAGNSQQLPGDGGGECETPTSEPEEPSSRPEDPTSEYPDGSGTDGLEQSKSLSPTGGTTSHEPDDPTLEPSRTDEPTEDPDCDPGEDPTCEPEEDPDCDPGEDPTITEDPEDPTEDPTVTEDPQDPTEDPTETETTR